MDKLNFDINQFLRFLLAGGWAIACYLFINPTEFKKGIEGNGITSIIFALIIGSIIYIIHRALIYPNIYKLICFILWICRIIKKWDWGFVILFIPSPREIRHNFRRWSERKKENSFSSKHIIEWGSQVHFLYCSAFACLASILISKGIVRIQIRWVC